MKNHKNLKKTTPAVLLITLLLTSCFIFNEDPPADENMKIILETKNVFEITIDGKKTVVDFEKQDNGMAYIEYTGESKNPKKQFDLTKIVYHNNSSEELSHFSITTDLYKVGEYLVFANEKPSESHSTTENLLKTDKANMYCSYNAPALNLTPGILKIENITEQPIDFKFDKEIPGLPQPPPGTKGPYIWRRTIGTFEGTMAKLELVDGKYIVKDKKKVEVNFRLSSFVWSKEMSKHD